MYDFHYNYIKRKCDAKLLLTDTNSLVMKLKQMMLMKFFYKDKNLFDFSDHPQDSKSFDLVNEKFIGKMKDYFKGKIISEFVG